MALIDYVRREDAEGEVRELLDDWIGGGTANRSLLLEAIANHPPLLEGMYTLLDRTIRSGSLDRELKELSSVVVSQANECEYCATSHRENLVDIVGMTEAEVEAVAEGRYDELPPRERSVAEFAELAATDPKRITEADFDPLYEHGFDEEDVVELLGVIGTFEAANTYVDALSVHPADREEDYGDPLM
ncbi:MAG: carboxymuconolactone decarboxylase family protein [Halodesulfurarchaeum sp.]